MNFRRTKALLLASVMTLTSVTIAVPASADVGSWSDNGDGSFSYTQGNDGTASVDNFYLDLSGVDDWSAIKYISIDVKATSTAQPVIGASYGEDNWKNGDSVWMQDGGETTVYFAIEGEEPESVEFMLWNINDTTTIAADTEVTLSNITFSTEEMPDPVGAWFEKDGEWHYTHGTNTQDTPAAFNLLSVKDENIAWADIKYVSVEVTSDKTTTPAICPNFDGGDNTWIDGNGKQIDGEGTVTVYYEFDGQEPQGLELRFWHVDWENGLGIEEGANVTINNVTFSTEERDMTGVTGEWYEKDGKWHYTHGDDTTQSPATLNLLALKPGEIAWADVKYISAVVTSDNDAMPVIGGNLTGNDGDWTNGSAKYISGPGSETIFIETESPAPTSLEVQFWHVDWNNNFAIEAGTNLTVSNIVFSTEERDMTDVTGEWYEQDGKWYYRTGDAGVPDAWFDLMSFKPDDVAWADIKYVSADIAVDGKANPVITANDGNICGSSSLTEDGNTTLYLNTNGNEIENISLNFWWYDEENQISIAANTLLTLSNIVFSTEERDMTDVTGEWYEQDGKWYYRTGDEGVSDAWFDLSPFKSEDIAWTDIKYISADISVDGKACPLIIANDWALCTQGSLIEDSATTLYLSTNGEEINDIALTFWWYEDPEASIAANTLLTLSNIVFSTEDRDYSDVYNEWYEQDGKWYYRTGDEGVSDAWFGLTSFKPEELSWTDIEHISADVAVDGKIQPVLTANEGAINGTAKKIEDGTTTIYLDTFGKELSDVALAFWWYDDSEISIAANTLVTLSNVKFSTEPRDFSKVFDEWYQIDETTFEYKAGTSDIEDPDDVTFNDFMDVDMTGVKYFTADITVDGTMDGALVVYSDGNNTTKVSQAHTITDTNKTIYMFCDENGWNISRFDLWKIEAGTKVTVSNVKFYTDYIKDYRDIVGQWVQIGDNDYYYNHGDLPEGSAPSGLPITYDGYDMSDVQTISMKLRHVTPTPELYQSAKVHVTGLVDDEFHPGYVFLSSTDEQTVVRKYRGILESNPMLEITWISPNLEVYITDLTFSTEEIAVAVSTPNDVVVDDNETVVIGGSGYCVMWFDLAKMEVKGTLNFNVELTDSATDEHYVDPAWNNWTVEDGWTEIYDAPVAVTESCTMEIPITEDVLKMIHETASHECELAIQGTGIKVSNFVFTPKSDAPEPEVEEFKPEALPEEEKQEFEEKLEQSKENTVDESKAKDTVHNGKPQGHKQYKKDKHGRDVYALRIVQMVDKKLLQHAKDVTITVYSKLADQYVTFTAECCFSYLNINGEKVKAGGDHAFLTVIIDNVRADDEITFTDFTINYKK